MTKAQSMLSLAEDYLAERRRLGFELTISGAQLKAFARFVDESGHTGPLTTGVVRGVGVRPTFTRIRRSLILWLRPAALAQVARCGRPPTKQCWA